MSSIPSLPPADATDVVYVGEFRHIKGADLLIDAVARLRAGGKPVTLTLAATARRSAPSRRRSETHGLGGAVHFIGHVKARFGFSKGKLLVVPSRGNSMPYVVIEAAAAGIPMIAANVGGIPEIFGPHTDALFASNSVDAMADAILRPHSTIPQPPWHAPNHFAKGLSCISRRTPWSKGCSPGTATRLRTVNRSLPTITVSSDLSSKP